MKKWIIGISCLLLSIVCFAQKPVFTTSLSLLDSANCPEMYEGKRDMGYQRCDLFGHYYLLLTKDNYRHRFLTVGNDSLMFFHSVQLGGCGVTRNYGKAIEWQIADGQPFAGIVKYYCLNRDTANALTPPIAGFVVVFGLQGFADIDIELDMVDTPDAFSKARMMAREAYLKHFRQKDR